MTMFLLCVSAGSLGIFSFPSALGGAFRLDYPLLIGHRYDYFGINDYDIDMLHLVRSTYGALLATKHPRETC